MGKTRKIHTAKFKARVALAAISSYEAKITGIAPASPAVASSEIPGEFFSTDSTKLILEVKVVTSEYPIDLTNLGN